MRKSTMTNTKMTIYEAINLLRSLPMNDNIQIAINMAIEALEEKLLMEDDKK